MHHTAPTDGASSTHDADTHHDGGLDAALRDSALSDATFDARWIDATTLDASDDAHLIDAQPDQGVPDAEIDAALPPLVGITYVKPGTSDTPAQFGASVALSADTLVVGAPYDSDPSLDGDSAPGAVYIFARTRDGWAQRQRITRNVGDATAMFGRAVSISNDTIAVGAEGRAYVLTRRNGMWSQPAPLSWGMEDRFDYFGLDVAVSGDTIIVGAPAEGSAARGINGDDGDNTAPSAGAAYVYVRSGDRWTKQAYLKASNAERYDGFGGHVAISNDTVVIGAQNEGSNAVGVNGNQSDNSVASGAAYVFVRRADRWTQEAYLKASNTHQAMEFGSGVAISNDTIAVGACGEAGDHWGVGVDDSYNYGSWPHTGAAYVFARSGSTWTQQAYVKPISYDRSTRFGENVALWRDTLVVGTRFADEVGEDGQVTVEDSGAVHVYQRNGTQWATDRRLRAPNANTNDWFGIDVAIFDTSIAVGAQREASNATGVNGDQNDNSVPWAGAVYVFDHYDELGTVSSL